MAINKFTKENNKGEVSLQTIPGGVSYRLSCATVRNLYDGILEDTERGINKHMEGMEKENMLRDIRIATEINDMSKCLEEIAQLKTVEISRSLKSRLKE